MKLKNLMLFLFMSIFLVNMVIAESYSASVATTFTSEPVSSLPISQAGFIGNLIWSGLGIILVVIILYLLFKKKKKVSKKKKF